MSDFKDLIKVSCAICIKNNAVFLAKRSKGKHLAGFWEFPGGKVELGEDTKDALVREIKEELETDIEVLRYFDTSIYNYGNKSIELISFICVIDSKSIRLNDHDKVGWFEKTELYNIKVAPADISFLKKINFN